MLVKDLSFERAKATKRSCLHAMAELVMFPTAVNWSCIERDTINNMGIHSFQHNWLRRLRSVVPH